MHRRTLLGGLGASAVPAGAIAAGRQPRVELLTGKGLIVVELAQSQAPITCANFLHYVTAGRFSNATFYRASRSLRSPGVGLIEGGLQNDPKKLFAPIAHESTFTTGLRHLDGTISMAREAPGTATADFFICSGAAPYLDANPILPGDNAGFAAFGHVVDGMDVVRAILSLPTTGVPKNPLMKDQILDPPVLIMSAKQTA